MRARLVLLLGLVGAVWGCRDRQPSALERVKAAGVLRWGGDVQGGEPYVFEDPKRPGRLAGFEVEIAEALARALGVRAAFVQHDWSTLVPGLERGTFDIVMNGLEVTPARQQRVLFTRPYLTFAEQLVARADDSSVRDLASLAGRRVGTLASSLAWDMLLATSATPVPYEGVEEPFLDLLERRIDAVLIDDVIVARYGRRPGLRTVGDVGRGAYAIAIRRGEDDLSRAVDGALASVAASGELDAILDRWGLRSPAASAGVPPPRVRSLTPHQVLLFLRGAGMTLALSAIAMALAIALGLLLAVARLPTAVPWRRAASAAATAFVEVFRGTPVLLQLYVIYFGLAPVLALDAFFAAVLGLGLNYAAYEAEIYRAGIQAVPRGEIEAAQALGMPGPMVFRRVVLPQALRFSLPGMANDFIALLKDSSLVSVITVVELTKRMTIAAVDVGSWVGPGLLCAALYFAMSYPLSRLARRLEARLGRT